MSPKVEPILLHMDEGPGGEKPNFKEIGITFSGKEVTKDNDTNAEKFGDQQSNPSTEAVSESEG